MNIIICAWADTSLYNSYLFHPGLGVTVGCYYPGLGVTIGCYQPGLGVTIGLTPMTNTRLFRDKILT